MQTETNNNKSNGDGEVRMYYKKHQVPDHLLVYCFAGALSSNSFRSFRDFQQLADFDWCKIKINIFELMNMNMNIPHD